VVDPGQASNLRVLVADDEATSRLLLSRALARWGYKVEVATDGAQAWEILQRPEAPALAVIDWMMPGLDGPAICRRLRERDASTQAYTYVLLLTSKAESRDVVDGLGSGADDYLIKPVDLLQLQARLRVGHRILNLEGTLRAERAEYQRLAMHDALTGIWNRGALLDAIGRELERGRRESRCVALIMFDIDRFKSVNDTHGHGVGDEVIIETARRLTATIRSYDSVGRLGGEEFLAVLTVRAPDEALALGERMRLAIASVPFATSVGPLAVTSSVGVATTTVIGFDKAAIMAAADQALYQAKHNGRNRVEVHHPPPATADRPASASG
jgi:two-component system, cell cycle response regulator